jgi:tetratricopeptide (TPR) repeat protein
LALIESSTKPESPGILKAGSPSKSLANWQGRTEEIANLKQWLNNQNISLIGIEGIGGTGKSMLAAKIYEDEEIKGFTKRFWADVSYGAIFTDVATQVLQKFGYKVPNQEIELVQTLVKCLQSGAYLLIIDNLESLLKSDGTWGSQFYEDFFKTWVECGGKSKVIVTTRERPELPKRFQWLPLSGLKIADGVALLTALGIQGNLEEFVKLVDGYPLLLQFVADLLKEEYPQDPHLKRLENLGLGNLQQLLTDKKVVGQHRRENVGMVLVLDASFGRLSELQKSLLQNISVYRGAVNSKAAVAVCPGSSETEIERELRNLVKRSFLSEKLIDDGRWFEFQPVVLEYVRYKAGDQTEAHQQAINYYRSIVKEKKEIGNIQGESYSLGNLGNAYDSLGQYERAIAFHQQSLDIKKEIGDIQGESNSLIGLGNAYKSLGQYERAIAFHQQSLDIKKEIGDIRVEATAWFNLGLSLEKVDREQDALGAYRNARELYQTMGLDTDVQNCNNAIEGLSQPKKPVVSQRGFWGWLRRLWRWVRGWFRRSHKL